MNRPNEIEIRQERPDLFRHQVTHPVVSNGYYSAVDLSAGNKLRQRLFSTQDFVAEQQLTGRLIGVDQPGDAVLPLELDDIHHHFCMAGCSDHHNCVFHGQLSLSILDHVDLRIDSNRSTSCVPTLSRLKFSCKYSRPLNPISRASILSSANLRIAAANANGFPGSTKYPHLAASTTSRITPSIASATGRPAAM